MIWSMVRGVWWIHEVLIRSISTWGQCFVTGSSGCAELGGVQSHVNELLLQERCQVLCKTRRKAENGPHVERLKLEFQFLLLCQWEMCKIRWARTQQEIFGSETRIGLGKAVGCWVTSSFHQDLANVRMRMFLQVKLTPLRAANTVSVVWEVVAPTPCSTQLKTPVSLDEAQVGSIFCKNKSYEL